MCDGIGKTEEGREQNEACKELWSGEEEEKNVCKRVVRSAVWGKWDGIKSKVEWGIRQEGGSDCVRKTSGWEKRRIDSVCLSEGICKNSDTLFESCSLSCKSNKQDVTSWRRSGNEPKVWPSTQPSFGCFSILTNDRWMVRQRGSDVSPLIWKD